MSPEAGEATPLPPVWRRRWHPGPRFARSLRVSCASESSEALAHFLHRQIRAGLDCAQRFAEARGNLGLGEAVEISQLQSAPLRVRQFLHCAPHCGADLSERDRIISPRIYVRPEH